MGKKGINLRYNNGNYKNGRTTQRGYELIKAYTHPFAPKNKYMRFHRYVLEIYYSIKFGFPVYILPGFFDVHHKNRNRKDNRIENLQLISHSAHTTLTNNTERIYKRIDHNSTICLLCGSDKTSFTVRKGIRYYKWNHYKDGRICNKCYNTIPINNRSKHDILNTLCLLCGSNKTRKNKKGIPLWLKYKDGYICQRCYDGFRIKTKRPRKVKTKYIKRHYVNPIRLCILCKTDKSITKNRSMWYKYKNKFDICIKCNGYMRRKYNNPFHILDLIIKYHYS